MPNIINWIKWMCASVAVLAMLSSGTFAVAAEEDAADSDAEAAKKALEQETQSIEKIRQQINGGDAAKAALDLESLALKGNVEAQLYLGDLHLAGDKILANDSIALQWYMQAANKNNTEGQFKVAEMFRKGLGAPYSLTNAANWYLKAAEKNHVESQVYLGKIYSGQLGGSMIDYRKAEKWLVKASDQGDFDSELALYEMYDKGYKPASDQVKGLTVEEADPESNAGRIRKVLLAAINKRTPVGGKLEVQGVIRAHEEDEGWFSITIPPLKLVNSSGASFAIGQAKFKFKPVEGQLDAAGEPSAYRVKEVDQRIFRFRPTKNGTEYIITYKVRRLTGLWRPDLNAYAESDAEFSDFMVRDSKKGFVIKAERMINVINLTESAAGVWGGPSWMELGGVTLAKPGGPTLVKIESTVIDYSIEGYDPKALEAKALAMLQPQPAAKSSAPPMPAINVSIKATLNKAEALNPEGVVMGGIDALTFGFSSEIDYPRLTFGLSYSHGGMYIEAKDDKDLSDYAPFNADAGLRFERLPLDGLFNAVVTGMMVGMTGGLTEPGATQSSGGPSVERILAQGFAKKMFKSFEKSKTRIIVETNFDAIKSALRAKGALNADAKALYGFSGGFDIMVRGLEGYIESISKKPDFSVQTIILNLIHKIAETYPAPDGAPLAVYHIDLNRKGQLLVNGNDFSGVFKSIKAAFPPEPEPEEPAEKIADEPEPPIQEDPLP